MIEEIICKKQDNQMSEVKGSCYYSNIKGDTSIFKNKDAQLSDFK